MKKAQMVTGQIFIYVLAALIFTAILAFGYSAISDLLEKREAASLLDLKYDLQSAVKSISSTNDVIHRKFYIPDKFNKICFLSYMKSVDIASTCVCDRFNCPDPTEPEDYNPLLCNLWKDAPEENVFLLPLAGIDIEVGELILNDGFLCVPIQGGVVTLSFEGKGNATKITIPNR